MITERVSRPSFFTHLLPVRVGSGIQVLCCMFLQFIIILPCAAQDTDLAASAKAMKKLSVEELMNIDVTSISMRPEKLTEVASAVQVITGEEIRRSGVTRLPEALRLIANLQVAQANSHDWAITARGFNGLPSSGGVLANKLLVMIDGRSVYNPLFGGVYWDVQNVLIEDIDRIEVVSGPGGTLWGANAVNGVINIITKSSKDTHGLFASAAAGTFLQDILQARYGFNIGEKISSRVYVQRMDQRHTIQKDEKNANDPWEMTQGGFRFDYSPDVSKNITVQGDFYRTLENKSTRKTITDGQNIIARVSRSYKDNSDLRVQFFFDRTWRDNPSSAKPFYYQLVTYDLDLQYRFQAGTRQTILSGIAYRFQRDKAAHSLIPLSRDMPLYSGFIQDEITAVPQRLKIIAGTKFLHNIFSGFEVQPTVRLAWTPNERNTIWSAVSSTVRAPTRFDSDITVNAQKFDSEKVIAYEVGYRMRPIDNLTLSLATFYNIYHQLRSLDSTDVSTQPIILANSQRAESWGLELSGKLQAKENWALRGGFTYFDKTIWAIKPRVLDASKGFEGVDNKTHAMLQSIWDISASWQLDVNCRYFSSLPAATATIPRVPEYFTFNVRLAWIYKSLELSVVGQNLTEKNHTETGISNIPRTVYGKLTWRMQ